MEEVIQSIEEFLVKILQWPLWAIRLNSSLIFLVGAVWLLQQLMAYPFAKKSDAKDKVLATWAFRSFQLQYLSVYLITMLADWLQGTHMYTLYQVCSFFVVCLWFAVMNVSVWCFIVIWRAGWYSIFDWVCLQCHIWNLPWYLR